MYEQLAQKEKMEAIKKATIQQLKVLYYLYKKGEISELEATHQKRIILDSLNLQIGTEDLKESQELMYG